MKRIFCIVFLIFVFSGELFSQDKTYFGIKGGINFPRLYYTNTELKDLSHDMMIKPSFSVFLEFPLSQKLAVAAEINYQTRGGATSYVYQQNYDVNYKLEANYLSFRLPFYWYFSPKNPTTPYLMLGPDFGYVIGGEESLTQPGLEIDDVTVSLNDNNYNPYYVGLLAGVGLRHKSYLKKYICITKLDVAFNWGFLDTFNMSYKDETIIPANIHAYNPNGERYSRSLEVSVSFGFIRHEDMSACREFK